METQHTTGAPGWRELRQQRIARQRKEALARKQSRGRPSPARRGRDDESDDDSDDAPPARAHGTRAAHHGKASAIVTRGQLTKQRGGIERMSAWIVLLISFVGSVAAMHGGFGPLTETMRSGQYNTAALIGGVLLQLLLTFLEWWYFDAWRIAWSARLVDAATTALGYGPLLLAPLTLFLYNRGIPEPQPLAWLLLGLLSIGIAWFPENRLVD